MEEERKDLEETEAEMIRKGRNDLDVAAVGEVPVRKLEEEQEEEENGEEDNGVCVEDRQEITFLHPEAGTPAFEALEANANLNLTKANKMMSKLRGLKRPKMKSLNVMKQLRKYTKQEQGERVTRSSANFKGKVIDGVHELYTLTAGMMLGIRVDVGKFDDPKADEVLTLDDFNFVEKITFPAAGCTSPPHKATPPHSLVHTFLFKSYSPKVFARMREFFGIENKKYMQSVCGNFGYIEFISNSKYMIKTQTKDENKFMKRVLPHYYKYITENPHTLLVRILGMHRVKMYHLRRKVHFVIMQSVFDTPEEIHTMYDLKGSLVGRQATQKQRENGGVLKDQDLLLDQRKLHLGNKKAAFMEQLERDARFLATLNIMDYSLLVGIHHRSKRGQSSSSSGGGGGGGGDGGGEGGGVSGGGGVGGAASSSGGASVDAQRMRSNTPFRRRRQTEEVGGGSRPDSGTFMPAVSSTATEGGGIVGDAGSGLDQSPPSSRPTSLPRKSAIAAASRGETTTTTTAAAATVILGGEGDEGTVRFTEGKQELRSSSDEFPDEEAFFVDDLDDRAYEMGDEDEDDELELDEADAGEEGALEVAHLDEGDSDEDGASSSSSSSSSLSQLVASSPFVEEDDGIGLQGPEGKHLSRILKTGSADKLRRGNKKKLEVEKHLTFGPGQAQTHPWTSRKDSGVNSRIASTSHRGDEIYYMGVIDILQQYNLHKRVENFIKGFSNDRRQISAVDANFYATRFIQFFDAHID